MHGTGSNARAEKLEKRKCPLLQYGKPGNWRGLKVNGDKKFVDHALEIKKDRQGKLKDFIDPKELEKASLVLWIYKLNLLMIMMAKVGLDIGIQIKRQLL